MDHGRDPCPWVILNDFGGAFSMGAIGGTIWHGIKGFRNSPYGERRIGAVTAIKARAPVLGVRRKEDPYNGIIAGFFTGGSLAIRGGYKAARNGAIGCAVLIAVIEGVGIGFQRMLASSTKLEVRIPLFPFMFHGPEDANYEAATAAAGQQSRRIGCKASGQGRDEETTETTLL
ncbi:hypothetical protein DL766_005310 [Monosporascus sp. MC13-8B]|uniref:Mitochondrial import inner membrane translocase subunit TIM17 n=1 Tax=Monosporascus cannonballus TaxID=155416 RepID=A0ABY0GVY5_9PEZI|nr:hypothetical protein DL762_010048 [Monosporascus cannonballus]RYO76767.1 hypothetical protein DL763_010154 [Monosporascus cannonballus]RYP29577.1 hypothetical protein DL766_005310 [Monosporascus sp. MC13-8B]